MSLCLTHRDIGCPLIRFGITAFLTDVSIRPDELARACEERGFSSLYVPEHTHIPVSRRTQPPTGEAELPEEYRRTLDPFAALAWAAAATETLRVGTGICLVAQRDPIVTAKEVATLDHLSGGRFVFGVGYGWNREEMEDHGIDPGRRRDVVRERVLAMERLWHDDEASFEGEFAHFEPSWAWPKPVQRPRPPVLLGGAAGPTLFAHVAEFGDGWIPVGGGGLKSALPELHRAVEEAGRDPSTIEVVTLGTVPAPGKLDHFREIGVTEVVFRVPPAPAAEVLPELDRYAGFVESGV